MALVNQPRIGLEHELLGKYFGNVYWFEREGTLCAEIGLRTNSGGRYAVRFVLPDDYPDSLPELLVTHPLPLLDCDGRSLAAIGPEASMHVLEGEGDLTSICHYHPARWAPDMTLYKAAIKARIWLEAYELHLATRKPIDWYLDHMTESP